MWMVTQNYTLKKQKASKLIINLFAFAFNNLIKNKTDLFLLTQI